MAQKPSIPKGTRDFSPEEVVKRNYIFDIIKKAFQVYGFQPIETPSFENYDTLMGKYGEEGDRLIFKILNSGDFLKKVDSELLDDKNSKKVTKQIADKALRYDLTVPFARYVVQHQNDITFPFKRYQIQPVWRADRPQKGRFREFYQCDADVVGSTSLLQEVEFIQLYDEVFTNLGLTELVIKLNNRKILSGIAEIIQQKDKLIDFTVALDKLDKIGEEGVVKEMLAKGITTEAINKIKPLFSLNGTNQEKLASLKQLLANSEEGLQGVEELEYIIKTIKSLGLKSATLEIDVTLARGLNYYTGAIFEVVTNKVKMGSIGGGGRYDDLTGIFGLKDISGVGISFGLDRIYLVLEELDLFNNIILPKPKVLILNYHPENRIQKLQLLQTFREKGIASEIYPDVAKSNKQRQKQFKYAQKRAIDFVVLDDEISEVFRVKNTKTGEVITKDIQELIAEITKN
ncbi:MAG TPA: histidine--tRNA ligase [Flavobacteriia bacterium]|nr:histidine--tRNA ligase [Flavobacteriia bacterium]